jgi:25S rRNA (adenine2142-N1)-methyltransferase
MGAAKKQKLGSLSKGRPPMATASKTMSRKASRTLINTHHQLEKQRRQAIEKGDKQTELKLSAELAKLGGIAHYQKASLQGQSNDRGGDTSKLLLEWLPLEELRKSGKRVRMLEVGALSTRNACSASDIFEMVRIDLNSQEPGILQQDFMERPLPKSDADKFDMISLSLVLNFVPDAAGRGEMLRRTLEFLHVEIDGAPATTEPVLPSLFLVLPRSCVDNSRYLTDRLLHAIMTSLGYESIRSKMTQKLVYGLWRRTNTVSQSAASATTFTKREENPGRTRNNFAIVLNKKPASTPSKLITF